MRGIRVKFWGVRGSIATPGPGTVRFGGNTSCVEVTCGSRTLILDSGTGIFELGKHLERAHGLDLDILVSHLHWDHIQGFPFFSPAYEKGNRLRLHGSTSFAQGFPDLFREQMGGAHYPVPFANLEAKISFHEVPREQDLRVDGSISVRAAELDHPGGVLAFRIEYDGKALVYATDNEHFSFVDPDLVDLARGADLLVYDSMYTEDEYLGRLGHHRVGWGHSTWNEGVKVGKAAGVRQLALFHHDPTHDDDFLAALEAQAREVFPGAFAASEGLEIVL